MYCSATNMYVNMCLGDVHVPSDTKRDAGGSHSSIFDEIVDGKCLHIIFPRSAGLLPYFQKDIAYINLLRWDDQSD